MGTFNKYQFLRELDQELTSEIESGNIDNEDGIEEYINSSIDNVVIYNRNCFEICMELDATDFSGWELGEPRDISQLAYFALYEYVNDKFDRSELIALIENKEAE